MSKKVTKLEDVKKNQIHITYAQLRNLMSLSVRPKEPPAYSKLMNPAQPEKMSGKAKIKLMRLSARLNPILEITEKVRMGIVDKYCEKDEKGKSKTKLLDMFIPKYTKRDKQGSPMLDKKENPIVKIPDNVPQTEMTYDLGTTENEGKFNKELAEAFEQDAEVPGERIILEAVDIPDNVLPIELSLLEKLINFKE